ncbi:hypothetical protein [Laspinema olomoucense]|uniref:hypothetical protein n=2 Tax=Laspinema olomoucense TaxID=3231600 RepID=UPI0021BB6A3F|nr:hypothetical protein [Laspinema sp. D3c]MCT7973695.1 hypothetical protein [Laspinema sp. D3d]
MGLLMANPGYAQRSPSPCSNENPEQPSSTRREITNGEYGLRFQIPANYQTELRRDTEAPRKVWISIRNPTDTAFLDCATRNRLIGAGHQVSDVVVTIEPLSANIRSAGDVLRAARSVPNLEIVESNVTTIAGQDAIIYTQQSVYPDRSRMAAFIHPDRQHLVKIFVWDYGTALSEIDLEVMDMVISSLRLDR